MKKLVIFGAGERGISFKNSFLQFNTLFSSEQFEVLFCDNDKNKWETTVDGAKCYAPASCLSDIDPQSDIVVVANSAWGEIFHRQLKDSKFKNCFYLDLKNSIHKYDPDIDYIDELSVYFASKINKINLSNLIKLPDNGRMDSLNFYNLLGKDVTLYSHESKISRIINLIDELNNTFELLFGKKINITTKTMINNSLYEDKMVFKETVLLNYEDDIETTIDILIEKGILRENIYVITFSAHAPKINYNVNTYKKTNPVIVYTMGKVGTSTLLNTMNHYKISVAGIHHLLFSQKDSCDLFTHDNYQLPPYKRLKLNWNYYLNTKYLSDYIKSTLQENKQLYIMTGVRDLVSVAFSDYSQKLDDDYRSGIREDLNNEKDIYNEALEYITNYLKRPDWFEKELKGKIGFDVYNYEFNHKKGYQIIETDNVKLLIIRLEDLNRTWKKCIVEFFKNIYPLDSVDLFLYNANESSNKQTADLYKKIKQNIRIDPELIKKIYASQQMKHFYSEDELNSFKSYWLDKNLKTGNA